MLSRAGQSLVPVGHVPFEPVKLPEPGGPLPAVSSTDPDFEKYLLEIVGTAIQVGEGKLATCAHVIEAVNEEKRQGYLLTRTRSENTYAFIVWPFQKALRYIDPRT